jgi:hypothetical protein
MDAYKQNADFSHCGLHAAFAFNHPGILHFWTGTSLQQMKCYDNRFDDCQLTIADSSIQNSRIIGRKLLSEKTPLDPFAGGAQ